MKDKMRMISFHAPIKVINKLEKLVTDEYFPNRSEAIRQAIYLFFSRDLKFKCPRCHRDILIELNHFCMVK